MNRKLGVIAGLVLVLVVGHTANAAQGSATVSIDDATPVYGQTVILTATVDPGFRTGLHTVCVHDAGMSQSDIVWHSETSYSDDVGLYAPNWSQSAATCTASVVVYRAHGKRAVLGSLTFEVAG